MASFEDKLNNNNKLVLIDFFATWCGPCQTLAPVLEELKKKRGDDFILLKVDVDQNPELARQLHIHSVPTLVLFKEGEKVWKEGGVQPLFKLEELINQHKK